MGSRGAAADHLHGVLELTVYEADDLHNAIHGRIIKAAESLKESLGVHRLAHRIYVDVDVGAARVARTREVEFHPTNPVWNQSFRLHCAYPAAPVAFTVKSQHLVGAGVLGAARVPAARVATGEPVEGWLDLRGGEHGHATHTPKLRVRLRFLGVESDPWWDAGLRLPGFAGVTPAFFPERSGCRVTLYQNSHLSGGFDPGVRLAGGGAYRPARLWEDIFIGGIDLCDGRYDDENHTLFRDLDTTYRHDFMQNNFKHAGLRRGGPREPWHDVHCRLEGRAAWDVLANFEQRWRKQAPPEMAGCLLDLSQAELPDPGSFGDDEPWNVQVFRSIDDASVVGFPAEPVAAAAMGLTNGKDVTIDRSIQAGYVEAIRRARRFIYVENQYFLGGCASWAEDRDAGCLNLVPVEIALKVAAKIRRGERFAAYVVTPMWPEGEPAGDSVQAILRWNRLTVEMMYGIVTKAIDDAGLRGQAHPCDYLNFFCLGNREAPRPGEYSPPETPDVDTDYWRAQVNRRFPIYVHAKLMIALFNLCHGSSHLCRRLTTVFFSAVDDEYVMVGSANLNERSLAGNRDSEIAQGSYQPAHLNGGPRGRARGLVHAFRMSLWHEHLMGHAGGGGSVFLEPESAECVRAVRRAAEATWDAYTRDTMEDLPGHLLPFPITVSEFGEVADLTADGCFPDTTAPVKGRRSLKLPAILTT
uniref:Phospholipase D n=1 Tax=Oryza barthii TaxID=65489 RepID=A0A0D3H6Y4_9ORYZ